jgi:uncharacterized CHY-type Zn-finger protein
MAVVTYEVCDRCSEKVNYHSGRKARVRTAKIKWIVCGMVIESEKILCDKCYHALEEFLEPITQPGK